MNQFNNSKVSKRLKELRESQNWSQSELGEKLNAILKDTMNLEGENGKQTVSQLERGRKITIEIAFAYANIFGKSVDFILGRSDEWQPEYKDVKELTGLTDESIESLKKANESLKIPLTRTVNALIQEGKTLSMISRYLFYEPQSHLRNINNTDAEFCQPIYMVRPKNPNEFQKFKDHLNAIDCPLPPNFEGPIFETDTYSINRDQIKNIILLEIQVALKNMLTEMNTRKGGE
ncbi:MAG: hypothetical protein CVU87_02735 [Firmicutes bacterium HGW-Firmicutes-12]|jgi:transcriptional regulator with XRE-family HTH domain|nr:MAG: hypothetical protein CVU87_02735 [Firmicutes bacterium HGW-Firmicutes-12]